MDKAKLFTMRVDDSFFDELDSLRAGSTSRSATVREIIRKLAAKAEDARVLEWTRSHPLGPPPPPRATHTAKALGPNGLPEGRVATATPRRQADATSCPVPPSPSQPLEKQPRPKLEGRMLTPEEQAELAKDWRV